jgi:protein involved in polysaccharide export with SLBB domain
MKSLFCYLVAAMSLLMLASRSFGQESNLIPGASITVRLGGVPADESNQVSGPYIISSSGTLTLPHLKGDIQAAGLKPTALANKIMAAYKSAQIYVNPNIVVLASGASPAGDLVVTVGGEVRAPRLVQYRPGLDLFGAVTEAGGPSEFGDMRRVKLIRGTTERIIDMRKVNASNTVELQAGDKVMVPGG